jgi:hypothetical protein
MDPWALRVSPGGQMRVVEEVLDGDLLFTWGVLMQTWMVSQLNRCRRADSGDFSFGSVLVALVLGEGASIAPSDSIGSSVMERASIDASGCMFWLDMEEGRVAITLRPQFLKCGGRCRR